MNACSVLGGVHASQNTHTDTHTYAALQSMTATQQARCTTSTKNTHPHTLSCACYESPSTETNLQPTNQHTQSPPLPHKIMILMSSQAIQSHAQVAMMSDWAWVSTSRSLDGRDTACVKCGAQSAKNKIVQENSPTKTKASRSDPHKRANQASTMQAAAASQAAAT